MATHTRDELSRALGCVVYDMLILLAALSFYRRRHQYPVYPELTWGEPQIAIDLILLKSRAIMDFLSPKTPSRNDIRITDFGLPAVTLSPALQTFRKSVNQWTVHLSWQRALKESRGAPQPARADMEAHACSLLSAAHQAVCDCIAAGVTFTESRHQSFYRTFLREYGSMVKPTTS